MELEAGGKGILLHICKMFGTLLPMVMWEIRNVLNEFSDLANEIIFRRGTNFEGFHLYPDLT